jgi:BlaI family penicillinase repressor
MARPKTTGPLTPLELELMNVLWENESASVRLVLQSLPKERTLAYSTVQTMLNLLVKKGKATRELKDRAFLYRQAMDRGKAVGLALSDIVDRMFGGSAENLVMGLVESRQLEPEKLAELHKLFKRSRGKDNAGI